MKIVQTRNTFNLTKYQRNALKFLDKHTLGKGLCDLSGLEARINPLCPAYM